MDRSVGQSQRIGRGVMFRRIGLWVGWLAVSACTCLSVVAAKRPNVVLIISDDQGYSDFGFMGNADVRTPCLDELAARSARFPNGYVPSSVCRPSLVTLLTGLYPHEHGVHFNHPPPGYTALTRSYNREQFEQAREAATHLIRSVDTLPRLLADRGYRCLQTGKYWEGHFSNAGFTSGMTKARPAPGAKYGNKQLGNGQWVAHGNGDAGLAIGRETMKPIEEFLAVPDHDPYFIWYAPFLPHLPHDSPPRFFDLYDESLPAHLRAYYAACSQFDQSVRSLLDLVERHQNERETLIVFVVDNGFRPDAAKPMKDGFGYNYTRRSKRSPFEDGLRTPILVSMSGKTQPMDHDLLCSSVDIAPTILEASLSEVPKSMSGRSLWSLATGRRSELSAEPVFGEIYPGDATRLGRPSADVAYRWIRDGDFKLIVPHLRDGKVWGAYCDSPQLYDLTKDPKEQNNLAKLPAYRNRFEAVRTKLDRWWSPR